MTAPKSGVTVRMFRQGHGDCFLLAFAGSKKRPVYVLIDCGYKPGSNGDDYGLKDIGAVVDDIKASTNGHLDLVIITHEHQDHVNGFWKQNDPYFKDFKVDAAWFAWTENPEDDLANQLRERYGDQLLGLVAARNRLAGAGDANAAQRLDEFLSLELGIDNPAGFAAAAAGKKKDPEKSINKQGMKLIKDKAGKKNTEYVYPHKKIMTVPGVDGMRVFALGPPYNAKILADTDPKGSEAFPGQGFRARSSFFAAAEAADDPNSQRSVQPFARRFAVPIEQAFTHPQHGEFFRSRYGNDAPQPNAPLVGDEAGANEPWRRIDNDWLYSAEDFALYLNEGINNTSLVLAFELPKSKKVLLFVGDAQRGNWTSWTKGWKGSDEKGVVRDLMSRTVLYKVGHHGSHNATLNGTAEDEYPNLAWMGHGKYGSEFVAMITAVNKWALGVKPKPWRHPLPSIKTALHAKCHGRVFQTDTNNFNPPTDPSDPDWKDFLKRARVKHPDRLYFEYDIHDR
jgi:hypothetical protein